MNRVCIVGRITRDLELRYTPNGVCTTSFSIAVNRNFKNADGEYEADFINVVAWKGQAEFLGNYSKKGSLVAITGRLQSRSYDNSQGQKVYVTEVVAEQVQLLDKKSDAAVETKEEVNEVPVQEYNDPFAEYGNQVTLDDGFLD